MLWGFFLDCCFNGRSGGGPGGGEVVVEGF